MPELEISSKRLTLRPIDADDIDPLHAIWTEEAVRRFLWDGEVIPLERTREIVDESAALFEESGYGIWGVRQRDARELLGFVGFWHFRNPPCLELLFGLAPAHWGRGFVTESSRCAIDYAFKALGFERIEASTDTENIASIHALESLGMAVTRHEIVVGLDTVFFQLNSSDWQQTSRHGDRNRP